MFGPWKSQMRGLSRNRQRGKSRITWVLLASQRLHRCVGDWREICIFRVKRANWIVVLCKSLLTSRGTVGTPWWAKRSRTGPISGDKSRRVSYCRTELKRSQVWTCREKTLRSQQKGINMTAKENISRQKKPILGHSQACEIFKCGSSGKPS